MPLSCLDESGEKIHAFDLNDDQWEVFKAQNRLSGHFRMPCCDSGVVLKQSKRGTRFFAHKSVGPCPTADESEEHRHLKMLAVEAARFCGWHAETEVPGISPSGQPWRADVLATRGNAKVAIEVQWSGQVDDETLRRQQRYRESGVRGLWLLRQPGFPVTADLPAVCIGGDLKEGLTALLPYRGARMTRNDRRSLQGWKASTPMFEFLTAALSKRLKWGRPLAVIGDLATVEVHAADAACEQCGVITEIIVGLKIKASGLSLDLTPLDLTDFPSSIADLFAHMPTSFDTQHIKPRYSRTRRHSYLSNGCSGCDRIFGDFHLVSYWDDAKLICEFPVKLDGNWREIIASHDEVDGAVPEWWVIP